MCKGVYLGDDKREESGMLKRLLIGLMAVVFVLIGIHLSWGGLF